MFTSEEEEKIFSKYKKKFLNYVEIQTDTHLPKDVEYYARGLAFWKLKHIYQLRDNSGKKFFDAILINRAIQLTNKKISENFNRKNKTLVYNRANDLIMNDIEKKTEKLKKKLHIVKVKKEKDIFNVLTNKAIEKKLYGENVLLPIILYESFKDQNISCKLIYGYILIELENEVKYCLMHAWVDTDTKSYDVASIVDQQVSPELKLLLKNSTIKCSLTKNDYPLIMEDDIDMLRCLTNNLLMEIYNKCSDFFWEHAEPSILSFRNELKIEIK